MSTEFLNALPSADEVPSPADARATQVLRRFRVVFNAVRSHFQQVEKQVGLGGAQIWALSVVRSQPGIGISELAAVMDIHQSTASNLIKTLLKRELVEAAKAPQDRRNVQLKILAAGVEVLAKVPGPFEGVLPSALMKLSPETLARLEADLTVLAQVLQADESAGHIPLAQL